MRQSMVIRMLCPNAVGAAYALRLETVHTDPEMS